MIDSNVALCSLVRGPSSSDALRPFLKRASTISVAYGLYQAGRFAPTRLNPADHPKRDTKIPPPLASVLDGLGLDELRWISMLSGLPCLYWLVVWILAPLDFWGVVAVARRHGDALRREQRQGIELPEGRGVTELTTSVRAQLMSAFSGWLRVSGLAYNEVFQGNPPDLDKIKSVLCQYGRYLFAEGRPYYHFAETINSVSAKRPILRRSLQQAWDLCAMWTSYEPVEHHQAMPFQVSSVAGHVRLVFLQCVGGDCQGQEV